MSLYNDNRTSTNELDANNTTSDRERDKYFQEFREFDYGIDITDNIILIQDDIQTGLLFDVISIVGNCS